MVLADIEQPALQAAAEKIAGLGGKTLSVPTDVSDEAAVNALAAAAVDRFGAVHVVCNNAGVASHADPWFGPLSAWKWVLGVNPVGSHPRDTGAAGPSEPDVAAEGPGGAGRRRATKKDSSAIAPAMIAVKPKIADRLTPAPWSGPTPNAAIP